MLRGGSSRGRGGSNVASRPAPTNGADKATGDNHLEKLFQFATFADLTVKLSDGTDLKVHKAIVSRCDFFMTACTSNFKEANESVIEFPEDPPEAMRALLQSHYGYSIGQSIVERMVQVNDLMTTILPHTYDLAMKYALPNLCQEVLRHFEVIFSETTPPLSLAPGGWFWQVARYLYDDLERAPVMRTALNSLLQKNYLHLKEKAIVLEELSRNPALAIELTLIGGLDGNGYRL